MPRARRTFSAEYKRRAALKVIHADRTIAEVARELDVREQVLGRWVKAERERLGLLAPIVEPDFEEPAPAAPAPPAMVEPEDPVAPWEGPTLRSEIEAALDKMTDLEDSDQGLKALAVRYADRIDAGLAAGGKDGIKVMYLGPHLFNVLRELGGSPAQRKTGTATPGKEKPKKSKLQLLREERGESA
ncbi:transposase [Paeniglutamicibacter sp. R2-26]|uniref:transposase n=1 Tax=Paeniglutamicibacter sp. R2-26 TaxID=3144417 RepID=UPI003EE6E757